MDTGRYVTLGFSKTTDTNLGCVLVKKPSLNSQQIEMISRRAPAIKHYEGIDREKIIDLPRGQIHP